MQSRISISGGGSVWRGLWPTRVADGSYGDDVLRCFIYTCGVCRIQYQYKCSVAFIGLHYMESFMLVHDVAQPADTSVSAQTSYA